LINQNIINPFIHHPFTINLYFLYVSGPLSQTSVIVSVGSSAVLHCDCKHIASSQLSEQSPYIRWGTISKIVFERKGAERFQGEGYKDRVDVPEDELKKGNCSLIIKDIRPEDAGVYESYLIVKRSKRSIPTKRVFIQSVELSVHDSPAPPQQNNKDYQSDKQDPPMTSSSAGLISVPSQILMFTILTNTLLRNT
uniref:Immunoglobulin V-set domain-containing protein n=1 Tax=Astyanax mexicanus TaxID=7994 RepID=A0A3B1II63_ASTMX